jgi:hypothetical protein
MIKFDLSFVCGIAYIALCVGIAWGSAGQKYDAGVYSDWMPLKMFVALAPAFLFGLLTDRRNP